MGGYGRSPARRTTPNGQRKRPMVTISVVRGKLYLWAPERGRRDQWGNALEFQHVI